MSAHSRESSQLLRAELRQRRREVPSILRNAHDLAIGQNLQQLIRSRSVKSLACFWPFDGEPDLISLYRQLMAASLEIALPVISEYRDHGMEFHAWHTGTGLIQNRYGIPEPEKTISMPVEEFDMLLLPLVAYDKNGNRMGMGSGYYDRHLESVRDIRHPLRLGVAYSLQQVASIKNNDWDIPLHALITEQGLTSFE